LVYSFAPTFSGVELTLFVDQSTAPVVIGPGISRGPDVNIYSSTSALPGSSLLFAFGTGKGILTMDKAYLDTTWASPNPRGGPSNDLSPKDVFALDFLGDHPDLLLSGGRNGILQINDLRVNNRYYSPADVIQHPSSITHIKHLDSYRLVVAGLNSSLCQYDIRFRKPTTMTPRERANPIWNAHWTKPTLQYQDYFNTANIRIGFDIDLESGVIAASQEDSEQHTIIQLFSLDGGQSLPAPGIHDHLDEVVRTKGNSQHPLCLKFSRDFDGRMKSLYVGIGRQLQRFSWAEV
jgi:hypothetical protein